MNLIERLLGLLRSDFNWLGRILIRGLRYARRHGPRPVERSSKEELAFPGGPFTMQRRDQMGDLLLWVPRHIESYLIDDLTGRFGYSHVTVDTGEVDVRTGKAVMVEVTVGQKVERKFQDEYATRPYVRVPLSKTGVNVETFVGCVLSKLGEPYSNLEALTLGEIDDPAKQVCSSLASDCLPGSVTQEIAKAKRLGLLQRMSVSVHSHPWAPQTDVFVSPNGFAQYYGAPKGAQVRWPDVRVEPRPLDTSIQGVARKHGWKVILLLLGIAGILAAAILHRTKSGKLNASRKINL
jgi:hypothetical protein